MKGEAKERAGRDPVPAPAGAKSRRGRDARGAAGRDDVFDARDLSDGGPRVMKDGFDPAALPPWPGRRVTAFIRWLHLFDDLLGLVAAYGIVFWIRFGLAEPARFLFFGHALHPSNYEKLYAFEAPRYLLLFAVPLLLLYSILGLYDGHMRLRRTPLMWNLLLANVTMFAALSAWFFLVRERFHMRGFLPLVFLFNVPCTYVARRLTNLLLKRFRRRGRLLYRTLLVGTGREADKLRRLSSERRLKGHRIVERVPAPRTIAAARALMARLDPLITTVILAEPRIRADVRVVLMDAARRANRTVIVYDPAFLRLHNPFEYGDTINGVPLVHYAAPGSSFAPSRFRDLLSRATAAVLLVPAAPFLLLIALAVKLDTPGPALFVQERTGLDGKTFRMFKFRTMVADAEDRLAALQSANESDGALFKMHDDPRITRVGAFLRRTSLDEVPQLLNIVRGEMRFVGPRPLPCADIAPWLDRWQGFRQAVPPGLTCIWQCAGRSEVGFQAMSLLDIWYAHNRSWMLDCRIVARTFWTVVFGGGAY